MDTVAVVLVSVLLVGALAFIMRRGMEADAAAPDPESGAVPADPGAAEADEEEDEAEPVTVPVTSNGIALLPFGRAIRQVPLLSEADEPEWLEHGIEAGEISNARVKAHLEATSGRGFAGDVLSAGDFTGARARRDAEGAWRLETLGREGEFGFMPFETEAGARDALHLFEHLGLIQRPLDESGDPVPPSTEDFEEARRRFEETERELALDTGDDEPAPPADWSSRR